VLVVLAALIGRGLTVALRGWRVGMGDVIARTEQISATLAQLVVVAGAFLAIRLLVPTIRERELGIWYRLGTAPVVPAIVTTVFAATTGVLGPSLTLALAIATSVLALTAASVSLKRPEARAAGIVLALCGRRRSCSWWRECSRSARVMPRSPRSSLPRAGWPRSACSSIWRA
jgi:hypothetical protein